MARQGEARHRAARHRASTASTTSTGTHRAVGRRRTVAAWPVACVVLLGLLVAGWFGWNWADGVQESRAAAEAADCQQGDTTIRVAVDPALEQPVTTAANRWNRARTVVQEHCVHVTVAATPSAEVYDSLTTSDTGAPAAWLPDSTTWLDELNRARPDLLGSSGLPVATGPDGEYPFLAIAGDGELLRQHAAQSFQKYLLEPAQQAEFRQAGLGPADD
ncbi:ABC transporter substrate-binding protein [Saccharomonospora piscinae]|uniref:substrate-binding domain-containing protein n=1 Tax=Saccharomonospora piscinae TaxID=687388 RepID=UPI0011059F61|nr:substrate-binding domain-containing protein [Saccharomonospora piscinae]TLW94966.1 ABC transporter substrate-binding protein [Saccharomonospora piscinae]